MNMPLSERRQIENEMIFRRANELVVDTLDTVDAQQIAEGNPELISDKDIVLHFLCECSDEDCTVRIPIKLSKYQSIHKNRDAFVIKHKHQVAEIEKVIKKKEKYSVVEKNHTISEPSGTLNMTTVDNS